MKITVLAQPQEGLPQKSESQPKAPHRKGNQGNQHPNPRPAGYAYLQEKLGLTSMPHWHRSEVSHNGSHTLKQQDGVAEQLFRSQQWPGDTVGDHLEFALKYDGVNLGILQQIFETAEEQQIVEYIQSKPTSKYARRIWFFYEFLMEKTLPLQDITKGNYTHALDPETYYTVQSGEKSTRHRVVNNLLGPKNFCPLVRRTEKLQALNTEQLYNRCKEITRQYPPALLRRALSYLYSKETKSSFAIEHITPNASRIEKFIALLSLAEKEDFCNKEKLIELQNRIVDPRFTDSDYRTTQNYVGQTVAPQKELIHFISPKPEDLPHIMEGLLQAHMRMKAGGVPAVIHAAIIAYGFVFLHPFEDGNGRIHRLLIHNILSLEGAVPEGLMFPVSATMLKHPKEYDNSLEAFSDPLLGLIEYQLDTMGSMQVTNNTQRWYQYIDMTIQAETLYHFVVQTLEEELVQELDFLASYDITKQAIQTIIDMPDRLIDLFIRVCLQNKGTLSKRKRADHFDFLTDAEVTSMEQAVQDGYGVGE